MFRRPQGRREEGGDWRGRGERRSLSSTTTVDLTGPYSLRPTNPPTLPFSKPVLLELGRGEVGGKPLSLFLTTVYIPQGNRGHKTRRPGVWSLVPRDRSTVVEVWWGVRHTLGSGKSSTVCRGPSTTGTTQEDRRRVRVRSVEPTPIDGTGSEGLGNQKCRYHLLGSTPKGFRAGQTLC